MCGIFGYLGKDSVRIILPSPGGNDIDQPRNLAKLS